MDSTVVYGCFNGGILIQQVDKASRRLKRLKQYIIENHMLPAPLLHQSGTVTVLAH